MSAQVAEGLISVVKEIAPSSNPLSLYLQETSISFKSTHIACWRCYVGAWETLDLVVWSGPVFDWPFTFLRAASVADMSLLLLQIFGALPMSDLEKFSRNLLLSRIKLFLRIQIHIKLQLFSHQSTQVLPHPNPNQDHKDPLQESRYCVFLRTS